MHHNGRLEPVAKQTQQNGVSAAPLPARRGLAGGLRSSPQPQSPPVQGPTPQEVAAELRKRLLPDLRHNAAAFEAMAVLLDYTTTKLGAFAAPALRRDLEKTKSDVASTVALLEEAREQRRVLERERDEEREARAELEERTRALEAAAEQREQELQRRLAGHSDELDTLRAAHASEVATLRGQMDARALEAADAVSAATRGLREEYELELDRVTRRHEETLRAALGAARAEAEREAVQRDQEAARREAELAAQLAARGAAHEALREQSRRVMDSMKSDKDARTQALAARCRELQDEVDSLRSVLELRCDELQKSRRENDALRIAADQLPGAEQRISTLTARLEDLQVQLDRKGELESRLLQENSELHQSFSKEIKEKQMLSLQNEQLQFKLKQNTEVVNALAANMSDFHDVSAIMSASMNGLSQDRSRRSVKSNNNNNNRSVASPPESPRVKGVVEKSESVSYMLEMEADSTDEVVSRIYRRMASTPLASPAHAPHSPHAHAPHPRSAPASSARRANPLSAVQLQARELCPLSQSASATAITTSPTRPTPKQRTMSASLRVRSRSISSDSGECLSSGNWSPPASLPSSQQQQRLQRRSPDVVDEGLLAPSSGIGYDCSDIEDFSSSKSSSMSCSSESSELGGAKEHDEHPAEEDDEVEQAMFQLQQDHQDLMTASCGSVTLPQDAGGEAMICSEEMNEDEVSANGLHSSCEEDASCSEDDDSRGASGAGAGRARAGLSGLPRLSLPMTPTAGCGQSAINTPMDSSWSEDMELPVSLSETS
ncbi:Microtubule-associated tumor suppressor candidate 2 [Frankliniella fusca]|uniref:Microtubule-associated tumor suppressor candidate 2 n=1 Tax=Frankliniella fusca TaxID=407009 RepID=A0AAE1GTL1_9NEOP|nr:Microtubule-associated tumor suppressor candidate 2 [Frankliniella fusca]